MALSQGKDNFKANFWRVHGMLLEGRLQPKRLVVRVDKSEQPTLFPMLHAPDKPVDPAGKAVKPRHAAALALVGWYPMMPTRYGSTDTLTLRSDLPLSKWTISQAFDSADDCETTLAAMEKRYNRFIKEGADTPDKKLAILYGLAQCVSTDDPRLRDKSFFMDERNSGNCPVCGTNSQPISSETRLIRHQPLIYCHKFDCGHPWHLPSNVECDCPPDDAR